MGQTTLSTEDPTRNPHSALPSSCWLYQRQKDAVLNFILRLPILPLLFTQDQQGVTELTALNNKTLRGGGDSGHNLLELLLLWGGLISDVFALDRSHY